MTGHNWKFRHLSVIALATAATYALLITRPDWSEMHRWNRAVGDASLVLISLSMAIGPLSRLSPKFRPAIAWRREFGIYGVLLGLVHATIILVGWVEYDLLRLVGFEIHPATGEYVMVQHGFGLANIIGLVGLLYALVLASTSNDKSQRLLGSSVWKFVQQGTYVLWMLILVHTGYFLFMHFLHFHRPVPDPNWAQWPFVALVMVVVALQIAASVKTWLVKQDRRSAVNA